jgi:hypothetical protein
MDYVVINGFSQCKERRQYLVVPEALFIDRVETPPPMLANAEFGEIHPQRHVDPFTLQACASATQGASVQGDALPSLSRSAQQCRDTAADSGDTGHLSNTLAIQSQGEGVGELGCTRTSRTGIDEGECFRRHVKAWAG